MKIPMASSVRCANCGVRPATINWIGQGSAMDYVHGNYQRWCELCAARAQLVYAKERAADVPMLEARVAKLEAMHD